jgi:hypothetical protein
MVKERHILCLLFRLEMSSVWARDGLAKGKVIWLFQDSVFVVRGTNVLVVSKLYQDVRLFITLDKQAMV